MTTRANPGSRSAKAEEAKARLYGSVETVETPPAEPMTPQTGVPLISEIADNRLQRNNDVLQLRVNGVGLSIPVVARDRTERSVCCVVREDGWQCDLPVTDNVTIQWGDETLRAAFLGVWHKFEYLGIGVISFPLLSEEGRIVGLD